MQYDIVCATFAVPPSRTSRHAVGGRGQNTLGLARPKGRSQSPLRTGVRWPKLATMVVIRNEIVLFLQTCALCLL